MGAAGRQMALGYSTTEVHEGMLEVYRCDVRTWYFFPSCGCLSFSLKKRFTNLMM